LVPLPLTKQKSMAKVKFTFKGMSDTDSIQACLNLKTALTGNASFPTLPVSLTALGTAITTAQTKLIAAENAQATAKQATADKDTALDTLKALAMQDIGYVDLTANGNESIILSAGLPVRAAKTPQTVPNQVQNLSLTAGDNTASLDVHWDPLANGKTYEVQTSPDPFTTTGPVRDFVCAAVHGLTNLRFTRRAPQSDLGNEWRTDSSPISRTRVASSTWP